MADDLRARLAEALRGAPVHATVMRLDVLTDVYGPVDSLVDAVLAILQPDLNRLAAALAERRAPSPACKHGVLPEQGLCLYCGIEQRATVPGVEACYSGRFCASWGFCHRCAPELAEEASRRFKETDGSSEAYAAIVNDLTNPDRTKETRS